MQRIQAYLCEYCNKVLKSYHGMYTHQRKCFKHPANRACITCGHLSQVPAINNRLLTEIELKIYNEWVDNDEPTLHSKLIGNISPANYCNSLEMILSPLRTQCEKHNYNRKAKK